MRRLAWYNGHMLRADRVLSLLASQGRSQAWLARHARIAEATLSRALRHRAPRPTTIVKIAEALGVSPDHICDTHRTAEPTTSYDEPPPADDTQALLHRLAHTCLSQQEEIRGLTDALRCVTERLARLEAATAARSDPADSRRAGSA